ncbi:hypothetical protein GCM10007425_16300 [Lysinibacillus alkalisoli]|uniref:Uncharacterized protein n=1 Tax=Lysinibacillus alkalisoli TaxID=1911548 RepID=A0A917LH34_9BACI|nr:hypothetical protein [Lysinibacillus alkalisoli]GGG22578.1 hypothetical protein GCM10007425_16300 [Lysinibacillus alkalisoli]
MVLAIIAGFACNILLYVGMSYVKIKKSNAFIAMLIVTGLSILGLFLPLPLSYLAPFCAGLMLAIFILSFIDSQRVRREN